MNTLGLVKEIESGKYKMGVMLLGGQAENIAFVKELVRVYHYTKRPSN